MTVPAFTLEYPSQRVVFGPGRLREAADVLRSVGRGRPLVVCSWRRERSDDFTRLRAALAPVVGRVPVWQGAEEHVPRKGLESAWDELKASEVDSILSFGGGAAVELGKALAFLAGVGWEGFDEGEPVPADAALPLPHVAVPTTYAGTATIGRFGVAQEREKVWRGGPRTVPDVVIADPELTLTLMERPTAATGMTALAHCVEALYGPRRSPSTDAPALHAAEVLARLLPEAVEHPRNLEARTELLAASLQAGAAVEHAGSALHHALCHALGGVTGIPNGLANAIVLPHVIRFNAEAAPEGLGAFARAVGASGPQEAADSLAALAARMGLPKGLRDAGVFEQDLDAVADLAAREAESLAANPRPATRDDVLALLRTAW